MHGKAYVGDKLVMEGHLVAQIIKNKENRTKEHESTTSICSSSGQNCT